MRTAIYIIALVSTLVACNSNKKQKASTKAETSSLEKPGQTAVEPKDLLGKEWKLIELKGVPIVLDNEFPKKPYIKFESLKVAAGSLGCNGFGGKVEFNGHDQIRFSEITATEMACPNLPVEQGFLKALLDAKTYEAKGSILSLRNDKNESIATLEN